MVEDSETIKTIGSPLSNVFRLAILPDIGDTMGHPFLGLSGTRGTACPFAHGPEELAEITRIAWVPKGRWPPYGALGGNINFRIVEKLKNGITWISLT